ncbi:MAG: polysaccharide pyruvyl transferase family protein [Paludibacteraceae bacterium]|nr:polysaccharide pyruvyl transferase family protein [Paludibacteraceae bacterium]
MKIFLTGVETNNKGAELMLYSILQEIERKLPNAEVYIPASRVLQGSSYVNTKLKLNLIQLPLKYRIIRKLRIEGILRRLGIERKFNFVPVVKGADYLIDGSGLHFSDKFNLSDGDVNYWHKILTTQKKYGTKIIFLPQAFGPIQKDNTQKEVRDISDNSDLVYAREEVSYGYLQDCGFFDMSKVRICTDFTSLVEGHVPEKYANLKGGICIIPNKQMVRMGVLSEDDYISFLVRVIDEAKKTERKVYLLNHEGIEDEQLAISCQKKIGFNIEVVSGINALETKGIISTAYLVITSRFHGVASALNSCVPCLATSWSHKYACLFADYGQNDCVLSLKDNEKDLAKIKQFLSPEENRRIREKLATHLPKIQESAKTMWSEIWNN